MTGKNDYRRRRQDRRWRNEYRYGDDSSNKGYKARRLYEELMDEPIDIDEEDEQAHIDDDQPTSQFEIKL